MIKFSLKNKAFYDSELNYTDLPNDLVEITENQYIELLSALNSGCIVFDNLTYSSPRPSQFHEWNGSEWIDPRTQVEIAAYKRSLLKKLSKRQFSLYLYDNDKYDQVMHAIEANPRFKIEFDVVTNIERLSPTVSTMAELLGWSNEEIDVMWEQAALL